MGEWFPDPNKPHRDNHGSAYWGTYSDLDKAGMIGAAGAANQSCWPIAESELPTRGLFGKAKTRGMVIGAPEKHQLGVGSPGSGKSMAVLLLGALNDDGANYVVIDPKSGELSSASVRYRATLGEGAIIDPLGVYNFEGASLNPLDLILTSNDPAIEAKSLADALIADDPDGKIWVGKARNLAATTLLHLVETKGPDASLMDLAPIASAEWDQPVIQAMAKSRHDSVRIQAAEIATTKKSDKTWSSVVFSMGEALQFARYPGFAKTLKRSTFDPMKLRTDRFTLYIVLPSDAVNESGGWLRIMYRTVQRHISRRWRPGDRVVRMVIDEFPSLGRFEEVYKQDLPTVRGFGMTMHLAVQSLAQLQELYGDAGVQNLLGQCHIKQFMGVGDPYTAEIVSKICGKTTRRTFRPGGEGSPGSYDYNERDLITPAEVMGLPSDKQIVTVGTKGVFLLDKTMAYDHRPWRDRLGDWKSGNRGPRG